MKPAWYFVLDSADWSVKRLSTARDVLEKDPVWGTHDAVLFTSVDLGREGAQASRHWVEWRKGNDRRTTDLVAWKSLTPLHDGELHLKKGGR